MINTLFGILIKVFRFISKVENKLKSILRKAIYFFIPSEATKEPPRKTPSILIVSLPKSGTVYINDAFQSMGYKNYILSNGYFPADQLNQAMLDEFKRGDYVASAHIDPSPENMQLLNHYVQRWIVHLRDPRSSTLSWVHHIDRLYRDGNYDMILRCTPCPPREYFAAAFSERLQWQIDHYLPMAINWIERWLDKSDGRVLITEFTELRRREYDYMKKITNFLNVEFNEDDFTPPERETNVHYRRGGVDEWRSVFTPAQIEQATAAIPDSMKKRFCWV